MKIKGLDNKIYNWNLNDKSNFSLKTKKSNLHIRCRLLLHSEYATEPILEEVYLPGSNGLRADFYIPTRKLIVEVHGEEHYKFIQFFHKNLINFFRSKKRDEQKKEWCKINSIKMIELNFEEDDANWIRRIRETS